MTPRRRFYEAAHRARLAFRRGELSAPELEDLLEHLIAAHPWAHPGTERAIVEELLGREGFPPPREHIHAPRTVATSSPRTS